NAAGAVIRSDPTGRAGTDVGDVLTSFTNFHISKHSDILIQYSHVYSGDFIKRTGSPLSPDFFYMQYTYRW
ncbi:MAG: alginate export family protein, partial [Gemmataceae bacterium]